MKRLTFFGSVVILIFALGFGVTVFDAEDAHAQKALDLPSGDGWETVRIESEHYFCMEVGDCTFKCAYGETGIKYKCYEGEIYYIVYYDGVYQYTIYGGPYGYISSYCDCVGGEEYPQVWHPGDSQW